MNSMLLFAATEASGGNGGLLGSLGIDVRLLIVQSIAFLVLLWVLSKFVYPVLASMLDKREATIREGINAAQEAEQKADEAKAEMERLLDDARKQAGQIMSSAKSEAASVIEAADTAAVERAERIVADAQAQIEKDIQAAQKALHDETISLVALATEKVIGKAVTPEIDKKVIASAIKDVQ